MVSESGYVCASVELHEVISQLNTENKNLTGQLTFLKAEDGRMKEVVHKNVSLHLYLAY